MGRVGGVVRGTGPVSGRVSLGHGSVSAQLAHGAVAPVYAGPYVLVPAESDQTVPCLGLRMGDDLTVTAVPYSRVSNDAGGDTVTIGI